MEVFCRNTIIQEIILVFLFPSMACNEVKYILTSKLMNALKHEEFSSQNSPFIPIDDYYFDEVIKYISNNKPLETSQSYTKYIENLHILLQNFGRDRCLVVINNFANIDLHLNSLVPLIFRQFELAVMQKKERKKSLHFS